MTNLWSQSFLYEHVRRGVITLKPILRERKRGAACDGLSVVQTGWRWEGRGKQEDMLPSSAVWKVSLLRLVHSCDFAEVDAALSSSLLSKWTGAHQISLLKVSFFFFFLQYCHYFWCYFFLYSHCCGCSYSSHIRVCLYSPHHFLTITNEHNKSRSHPPSCSWCKNELNMNRWYLKPSQNQKVINP